MNEVVELTLAPPPLPFPCPPELNPAAWPAFAAMVAEVGPDIYQLPTSCEMMLRQHLDDMPKERNLLTLALRHDVPRAVSQGSGTAAGHDARLDALAAELTNAAGVPAAEAAWAVNAWATALGRPPHWEPQPPPLARRVQHATFDPTSERVVMGGIAGLGGALGGIAGNGAVFVFLQLSYRAVDAAHKVNSPKAGAVFVLLAVTMAFGAGFGFLGGFVGWWLGRGNERPWAGFGAAFGAAFGTGCLSMFCCGPGVVTAVFMGLSALGATYTTASRGGFSA